MTIPYPEPTGPVEPVDPQWVRGKLDLVQRAMAAGWPVGWYADIFAQLDVTESWTALGYPTFQAMCADLVPAMPMVEIRCAIARWLAEADSGQPMLPPEPTP